ncbi:20S cyclosome subunit [Grosmannia clavigera kw1407]|uniref:20S cyclosome subunit n=1 Tax=Grosmannia clavigera (strain kw1407 / UAMH 11150) TaxID=655863 RepID=F0XGY5_GROCL|nr:20S cyclosome subunit [Grosmannia clavigera kw1407]EFX03125.1 20S cyclosome subunit [Grosmannia clavigera kw1407]
MAPNSAAVANLLRQTIYYHLDNGSWDNSLFFSERLLAHDPRSNESTFLLALSHLRLGDNRSAYEVSKPLGYRGLHLGCAFVFAQSCLALERFRDGVYALEKAKGLWLHKSNLGKHTATSRTIYPDASVVNCLLGKLCRGMDDRKKAAFHFEDALRTNPLMWDAFIELCDMGVNIRVPNTFRVNDSLIRCFEQESVGNATEMAGPLAEHQLPTKRPAGRAAAMHDMSDPFDHQQPQQQPHPAQRGSVTYQPSNPASVAEAEENDFMARIFAARSRAAAGSTAGNQIMDGMATPPGTQQEPPQAPPRRRAGMPPPVVDSSFVDPQQQQQQQLRQQAPGAPSKMMYRLGASTRRGKPPPDGGLESLTMDQTSSMLRSTASATNGGATASAVPTSMATGHPSIIATSTAERKRTASGHPVAPRHAHSTDESGVPQRRSARLNMFKASGGKTNAGAAPMGAGATRELKKARPPISRIVRPESGSSTVGRVVSGNRKPVDDGGMDVDPMEAPRIREAAAPPQQAPSAPSLQMSMPPLAQLQRQMAEADSAKIEEALRWVLELVKKLGSGYLALAQFQCSEALVAFSSLPRAHNDTPWVQAQMGRAQYELAAYAEAETCFRRVRVLAPTRLDDMEVYSTILWFLKRETDLSFLAHELVDAAWTSAQAWCALGNAWSLAQDHEQALRCFRRATQLKPKFAYAYTLQGHEHVLNEEYDKALTAYRQAVAADRRHYNAYYGIGRVYEKLGNFDKAYEHYHIASVIHPTNAVLICCIGKVLERQKQIVPALQYFIKATDLAPRAAQTRFRKARALLALGQLQAAQQELMILKDIAPDEAAVHFLLGKLYKTLNDKSAAVRHFTIALSLDPKASQKIKQAIGSLEDDEDGLEEYMAS